MTDPLAHDLLGGVAGTDTSAVCVGRRHAVCPRVPEIELAPVPGRLRRPSSAVLQAGLPGTERRPMLAADKLLLQSNVKQRAIQLREKELNLFNDK